MKLLQVSKWISAWTWSPSVEYWWIIGDIFDTTWKDGYRYAKSGVLLGDFCDKYKVQLDLFSLPSDTSVNEGLMSAIDQINQGGRGKVWFGGQRPKEDWFMR